MYDVAELEKRWRRYRRKKKFAKLGVAVVLLAVTSGLYWLAQHPDYFVSAAKKLRVESNAPASVKEILVPIDTPLAHEVPSVAAAHERPPKKMKFVFGDDAPSDVAEENSTEPTQKVDIAVTAQKVTQTVEQLKEKFQYDKDKDDAMFLARYYYDKKDYNQAMKWALETNKLDSDIEESWLIFAKAKAKTDKRVEAIRILQTYYDRTGSVTAKQLLGLLRHGKPF